MAIKLTIDTDFSGYEAGMGKVIRALQEWADQTGASADDVRAVLREIDGALDDVETSVVDLGRSRGLEQLEDDLRGVERQSERTERAIDDIGAGGRRGFGEIRAGAQELQQEIGQNLGEAVASFRGDLADLGQVGQDTLGGLAATVAGAGPLGMLAAIGLAAGAAGLGALTAAFEESEEAAAEVRERSAEIFTILSDPSIVAEITAQADALRDLASGTDETKTNLSEWKQYADDAGTSFERIATNLSSVERISGREIGALERRNDELERTGNFYDENTRKAHEANEATIRAYEEHNKAVDEAQAREAAWLAAGGPQAEAKAEVIASIGDAYDSVRDAAVNAATTEQGAFDITAWLNYVTEHAAAVETYKANIAGMRLTPEQWGNLMEMPEGARMQFVAQFTTLSESARAPFAAALNDVGSSGASEAAVAFEAGFNPKANVAVAADATAAESTLTGITKPREVVVKVKLDTSEYDTWKPPQKTGKVVASLDGSAWDEWRPATKSGGVRKQLIDG